ncbi:MAG: hypothetical protein ACRES6_00670 [Steroidobacteraceae bacterium]
MAPRLGAEYIGCFKSRETTTLPGDAAQQPVPVEYAIALRISGGPFTLADMDLLLSRVREQWQNFKPLSREHGEYVARLNAMIRGVDSKASPAAITSIKPALISIARLSPEAYLVLSVRHYASAGSAGTITSTKADGTAMVLQGTALVRLEMLRELRAPSDVDAVRKQITAWAREVAADAGGGR